MNIIDEKRKEEIIAIMRAVANERPPIDFKTAEAFWCSGIRAIRTKRRRKLEIR